MDEATWLSSSDPAAMWKLIIGNDANVAEGLGGQIIATDRKLRLFACACCRQVWDAFKIEKAHRAVEMAERFADGKEKFISEYYPPYKPLGGYEENGPAWIRWLPNSATQKEINWVQLSQRVVRGNVPNATLLLRLIFNPFRPVELPERECLVCDNSADDPYPELCPQCLGKGYFCPWLTPDVLSTAQTCYDNRDATAFLPLWDQLETAGCTSEEIRRALAWEQRCWACLGTKIDPTEKWDVNASTRLKCRTCHSTGWLPIPGEPFMVRGHWVVDLLLGKE